MPDELLTQIVAKIDHFKATVEGKLPEWCKARSAIKFREMELEVHGELRRLGDEIVGPILKDTLCDGTFQAEASRAARSGIRGHRDVGRRNVEVTLLGGSKVRVRAEYFRPDLRGRRGRRRRSGRRGKGGVGLYPALAALGIWFGATPALAGEVCRQVADSDSVRAGRAALARRGIDLGHKQTLNLFDHVSHRACQQRQEWLERMRTEPQTNGPLAGKRVAIATDGGRIRERRNARGGRRRAKTGHRGFQAPWREPKMLVIYTLDDEGRIENTFRPVYDGTLRDCNAVFDMLVGYLRALGARDAQDLIVLGDGAKWIWERVSELTACIELDPAKVTQVIDWYHAVETLHKIAKIPAKWPEQRRDKWTRKAKRMLHAGKIDKLVEMIDKLAKGRRAKAVNKHRSYFTRNEARMQYKKFQSAKIPIGSGAVESAVRRIVNQRMKGNGTFWKEINAEGMLLIRSYLKSGRYDDLIDWSFSQAAFWWAPDGHNPLCPILESEAT